MSSVLDTIKIKGQEYLAWATSKDVKEAFQYIFNKTHDDSEYPNRMWVSNDNDDECAYDYVSRVIVMGHRFRYKWICPNADGAFPQEIFTGKRVPNIDDEVYADEMYIGMVVRVENIQLATEATLKENTGKILSALNVADETNMIPMTDEEIENKVNDIWDRVNI